MNAKPEFTYRSAINSLQQNAIEPLINALDGTDITTQITCDDSSYSVQFLKNKTKEICTLQITHNNNLIISIDDYEVDRQTPGSTYPDALLGLESLLKPHIDKDLTAEIYKIPMRLIPPRENKNCVALMRASGQLVQTV